jgi:hypothetical protein
MATSSPELIQAPPLALCVFDPEVRPYEEPQFFDSFISESDLIVWIGREKHRKSNLLLQLAICAARGHAFLTLGFVAPGPLRVLYVDYESKSASLKLRYDSICKALGLTEQERQLVAKNLHILEVRKMRQEGKPFPRFPLGEGLPADVAFWRRLIEKNPADIYIIDPMRCFHIGDENDSKLEKLFEQMRRLFGSAAVIISQHMRKKSSKKADNWANLSVPGSMREWSDGARGSGAIKAHADVIVCQERITEGERELVYFGAFMKDGPDIEPMPLCETEEGSFFFRPSVQVPSFLRNSYETLRMQGEIKDRGAASELLQNSGVRRSTAFKHVKQLMQRGLLVQSEGGLRIFERNPST